MPTKFSQRLYLAALASGLLFAAPSFSENELGIPVVVPYEENADINQAIKDECQLGEKMSTFLAKYIKNTATFSDSPAEGRFLDVEIADVHAVGGGAYSGTKWMDVQGALMEDGVPVASFRAKRTTRGGGWGACGAAQRCAKAISKDISIWLKDPEDGALLGNAK